MSNASAPKEECDIVMKGGITSGVVYPLTVVELSKRYRLRNIGGTSAGALAAAITAAAEYNRDGGGFRRIEAIPDEVATRLKGFFQPDPSMKPLFDALLVLQDKTLGRGALIVEALKTVLLGYGSWTLAGLLPGLALGWWAGGGFLGKLFAAAVCGTVGVTVALGFRLYLVVTRDLPAHDFGICSGKTQPGSSDEGLTDWLSRTIDEVAGRDPTGDPLTFAELWGPDPDKPNIRLDMMTTNLAMQRAHRLPLRHNLYMFRRAEFLRLFPARVVDAMVRASAPVTGPGGAPLDDYYHLPMRERLPVVVAARMSLSFPGLIAAVPLYARDYTLLDPAEREKPRRCLFSDGGLTSNFPIHFFDRFLPAAPTFAVALDSYRPEQHGKERVHLPKKARENISHPVRDIASFGAFLGSLMDSAKGWQDNLQSTLPGYRERIVHVALDDSKEGGLNLTMSEETIRELVKYGRAAGQKFGEFDFDEHRWRRFLVAANRLEESLDQMLEVYDDDGGDDPTEPFGAFLRRYAAEPKDYRQDEPWRQMALQRFDELMKLARAWRTSPTFRDGRIPRPDSDLRITARF